MANEREVAPVVMPGTDGVWSTTRFVEIDDLRHDMHVNIVNFQPGGTIPFPETHVMEHGLYVLEGKAVYLLNTDWVEVEAGDFMWLRAFCPQACYAGGPGPFRYLLYKDVNRHAPLVPLVALTALPAIVPYEMAAPRRHGRNQFRRGLSRECAAQAVAASQQTARSGVGERPALGDGLGGDPPGGLVDRPQPGAAAAHGALVGRDDPGGDLVASLAGDHHDGFEAETSERILADEVLQPTPPVEMDRSESYSPYTPASTSSRSGVPMCRPCRSNTGRFVSGRGMPGGARPDQAHHDLHR